MEKNMENEMATGNIWVIIGVVFYLGILWYPM